MRNFAFAILAATLISPIAVAKNTVVSATSGIASGIYSTVRESRETGDRSGVEFRLYADVAKPYVEAVICESECNGGEKYYITQIKDGFTFTWKNPRFPNDDPVTLRVRKTGKSVWLDDETGQWVREKMKPLKMAFGLMGVYPWALAPGCVLDKNGNHDCS